MVSQPDVNTSTSRQLMRTYSLPALSLAAEGASGSAPPSLNNFQEYDSLSQDLQLLVGSSDSLEDSGSLLGKRSRSDTDDESLAEDQPARKRMRIKTRARAERHASLKKFLDSGIMHIGERINLNGESALVMKEGWIEYGDGLYPGPWTWVNAISRKTSTDVPGLCTTLSTQAEEQFGWDGTIGSSGQPLREYTSMYSSQVAASRSAENEAREELARRRRAQEAREDQLAAGPATASPRLRAQGTQTAGTTSPSTVSTRAPTEHQRQTSDQAFQQLVASRKSGVAPPAGPSRSPQASLSTSQEGISQGMVDTLVGLADQSQASLAEEEPCAPSRADYDLESDLLADSLPEIEDNTPWNVSFRKSSHSSFLEDRQPREDVPADTGETMAETVVERVTSDSRDASEEAVAAEDAEDEEMENKENTDGEEAEAVDLGLEVEEETKRPKKNVTWHSSVQGGESDRPARPLVTSRQFLSQSASVEVEGLASRWRSKKQQLRHQRVQQLRDEALCLPPLARCQASPSRNDVNEGEGNPVRVQNDRSPGGNPIASMTAEEDTKEEELRRALVRSQIAPCPLDEGQSDLSPPLPASPPDSVIPFSLCSSSNDSGYDRESEDSESSDSLSSAMSPSPSSWSSAPDVPLEEVKPRVSPRRDQVVIVGSCLTSWQLRRLRDLAIFLGGRLVSTMTPEVTHVVTPFDQSGSPARRTLKTMTAQLRGVPVVSFAWATGGTQQSSWLEAFGFRSSAKRLFAGRSFAFHGSFSNCRASRLELFNLIREGGGKLFSAIPKSQESASGQLTVLCDGSEVDVEAARSFFLSHGHHLLRYEYLFDCISKQELLPTASFTIIGTLSDRDGQPASMDLLTQDSLAM